VKPQAAPARDKLLNAALNLLRAKGYSATTVDDLCGAAGVTKGAFFHHFESKEALAIAAAHHWSEVTGALFAAAPYHAATDPLARIMAYIDFREALLDGPLEAITCLAGTLVQEAFATHPAIRDACGLSITRHAATLESDFAAAMAAHGVTGCTPRSLAMHTQAVLQGGFILAKAGSDAALAADSIAHLKRYLRLLFQAPNTEGSTP